MNPNLCEIVCIIDRSGSMGVVRSDAIHGFNTFLAEQQKLPGEANLSLVLFNHAHETVHENVPLGDVSPLDETTYVPAGTTALLDAVGATIDSIGKRLANTAEEQRPAKIIVAILTDGEENASHNYTRAEIAERIKHQQEQYGWQFVFLAANMDAFAEAATLNIPAANTQNYVGTREGTQAGYRGMSETVTYLRADVGNSGGE